MNLRQALARGKEVLDPLKAGHEVRALIEGATGWSPREQLLDGGRELSSEEWARFERMLVRRQEGCPLQYILGRWSFMGLPFLVRPGVLIPRDDTELLCSLALEAARAGGFSKGLDLCTGSGCLAVSLALLGKLRMTASDISPEALQLAKENARLNGAEELVQVVESDLWQNLREEYDLIVTNPPYIPSEEISSLQREVREYEPHLALDGGTDGLDFYRAIAAGAFGHLRPGGMLLAEVGQGQAQEAEALFAAAGLEKAGIHEDLSGISRVVAARRPEK
jgi:release factor glutamine methyltransferase